MTHVQRIKLLPIYHMLDCFDEIENETNLEEIEVNERNLADAVNKVWLGLSDDATNEMRDSEIEMLNEFFFYLGPVEISHGDAHISDRLSTYDWMEKYLNPIAQKYGFELGIGAAESYHGCTKEEGATKKEIIDFLKEVMVITAEHLKEPIDNCIVIDKVIDELFGDDKPYKTIQAE